MTNSPAQTTTAGVLAHRGIATLLAESRAPSTQRINALVAGMVPDTGLKGVNRRAMLQKVASAIKGYFWYFVPPEPWRFVGAEVRYLGRPIDLVWTDGDRFLFDELKIAPSSILAFDCHEAREQTTSYAAIGAEAFGDLFAGLRCLPLLDPTAARFLYRGLVSPLTASLTLAVSA